MSYTIRDANHSDILDITIAAKLFSKETNHPALNTINPNKVAATLQQLLDSEVGLVKVACFNKEIIGAIAGVVSELPINDLVVAQELMLWLDPSHRNGKTAPKLIDGYVEWASKKGCDFVRLSALDGILSGKAGILFKRKGFKPIETAYIKEL
jgi:GNAT superfamily N-acetyltransferase